MTAMAIVLGIVMTEVASNTAAATISNAMGSAGLATTLAAGTSNISFSITLYFE